MKIDTRQSRWPGTVALLILFALSSGLHGQPKGVWVKVSAKDEMTNETELKKKCPKCGFLGKSGDRGLSYEMTYFSTVTNRNYIYRGQMNWDWNGRLSADSLFPGEEISMKAVINNLSGEATGSVSGWIQFGNWGFTKPLPGMKDYAGPNGSITITGSFNVPKEPALFRDGSKNLFITMSYHLSGGNETRFIRRFVTYKWSDITTQPVLKKDPPPNPPDPALNIQGPQAYPEKVEYKTGEPVTVVFKNLPGFKADWIGVYGAKAYHANEYIEWKYTEGLKEGKMTFNSPRYGAGEYMFRIYENNGYKLLVQTVVFKVVN